MMKCCRIICLLILICVTATLPSNDCGTSYPLPSDSTIPNSVAFSSNGALLATANFGSNNVTVFAVNNGILSNAISYDLPSDSTYPNSVAFSPDGSCLATANPGSNDVSLFTVTDGGLNHGVSYVLPASC